MLRNYKFEIEILREITNHELQMQIIPALYAKTNNQEKGKKEFIRQRKHHYTKIHIKHINRYKPDTLEDVKEGTPRNLLDSTSTRYSLLPIKSDKA